MRTTLGFDARHLTPGVKGRITFAAADTRSFKRATLVLQRVGDVGVSDDTIQRVIGDIGGELAERRDADPKTADALAICPEAPPPGAIAECDGGRIRAREPGHGRGVHLSGEKGWRETKNACLVSAIIKTFDDDPQPEPPACFCNAKHVAKLAETEALSVAAPPAAALPDTEEEEHEMTPDPVGDWRPKRLVRTVISSMQSSRKCSRSRPPTVHGYQKSASAYSA